MTTREATKEDIERLKNTIPPPVEGLTSFDVEGLANYINSGRAKNIIILQGAGVSTGAGIPDFRTPGTGLYSNLQKYNLPYPEAIFTLDYFKENPEPFYQLAKETLPGSYKPTLAHYLPIILQRHGILARVYTQNIDGLERVAGVPSDMIVECHGTYFTGHCLKCRMEFKMEDYRDLLLEGKIVKCKDIRKDGVDCPGNVKPDIVFFGEPLPKAFYGTLQTDIPICDLLLVLGTSLQVEPVNSLINRVKNEVPRVLINLEPVCNQKEDLMVLNKDGNEKLIDSNYDPNLLQYNHILNYRDIFVGGDLQNSVRNLIDKLGWTNEFETIVPEEILQKFSKQ